MSLQALDLALRELVSALRKLVPRVGEFVLFRPSRGPARFPDAVAPEDANNASERGLQAAFEHSAVGIALLDPAYRIVHANAAFERFLGYGMAELFKRPITDFSSIEDAESTATMLHEVGSGGRASAAVEARFLRRDESIGWGALSVSLAGATAGPAVFVLH